MISFRQLDLALAVQRYGSFSAAAKSFFISQPALSEAIQKLELELKVQLFDRSKSPVRVTEVGLALLQQAEKISFETRNLIEIADTWNDHMRGVLRLGLIPTVAPALIPLFLKRFRKSFPLVKIEIVEVGTEILLQRLQSGDIDAAILSTPTTAPGHLIEKPLYYEGFLVYAAKQNSLLHDQIIQFPDLEDQNLILMDESHCVRDQILTICERKKDHSNKTTVYGGLNTLLAVVEEENGFTLIPELLSTLVNKSQLRSFKNSNYRRKISLLSNKTYSKKRLIDLLAAEIQNQLPEHIPQRLTKKVHVLDPDKNMF